MKRIPLLGVTHVYALVDDEDFELLSRYNWKLHSGGYAYATVLMHRVITNANRGEIVDHIDRKGLNNQRKNLRIGTVRSNSYNSGGRTNNACKMKGVTQARESKRWRARIHIGLRQIHLGTFDTVEEAAVAYNEAATKYFGEYAYLNPISGYGVPQ